MIFELTVSTVLLKRVCVVVIILMGKLENDFFEAATIFDVFDRKSRWGMNFGSEIEFCDNDVDVDRWKSDPSTQADEF